MDVKLSNNDIILDLSGNAVKIDGIEEIKQQLYIGATIKRGSFALDTNMGLAINDIDFNSKDAVKNIEAVLKETLMKVSGVDIKVDKIIQNTDNKVIAVTVNNGYIQENVEVIING